MGSSIRAPEGAPFELRLGGDFLWMTICLEKLALIEVEKIVSSLSSVLSGVIRSKSKPPPKQSLDGAPA